MKGIEWDCKGLESIAEEAIKEKSDLSLKAIQDKKKYSALMQLRIKCFEKLVLLNKIDYYNLYQSTYVLRNILKNHITKYLIYTVKYVPITPHIWCCHDYILYFGEYE